MGGVVFVVLVVGGVLDGEQGEIEIVSLLGGFVGFVFAVGFFVEVVFEGFSGSGDGGVEVGVVFGDPALFFQGGGVVGVGATGEECVGILQHGADVGGAVVADEEGFVEQHALAAIGEAGGFAGAAHEFFDLFDGVALGLGHFAELAADEVGGAVIGVELAKEGAGGGDVSVIETGIDEGFFLFALGGGEDEIGLGVEGGDGEGENAADDHGFEMLCGLRWGGEGRESEFCWWNEFFCGLRGLFCCLRG